MHSVPLHTGSLAAPGPLERASGLSFFLLHSGAALMRMGLCSPDGHLYCHDKTMTSKVLQAVAGVRLAGEVEWFGRQQESANDCLARYLRNFSFPLVVKPADASCGIGVHTNITTREQALLAMRTVADDHSHILLQEFVQGTEYRIFLLDGEVQEIIRRDVPVCPRSPWYVQGDGAKSVKELVEEDNLQGAGVTINRAHLAFYGLTSSSVLAQGEQISVQGVLKEATFNRLAISHKNSDFRRLCERAAQCFPSSNRIYSMDLVISTSNTPDAPEEGPLDVVVLEMDSGPLLMESVFSQPRTDWSFWWKVTKLSCCALTKKLGWALFATFLICFMGGIGYVSFTPAPFATGVSNLTNEADSSKVFILNGSASLNLNSKYDESIGCLENATYKPTDSAIPPEYPVFVTLVIVAVWIGMIFFGLRLLRRPDVHFSDDDIGRPSPRRPDIILKPIKAKKKKKKGQRSNQEKEEIQTEFWRFSQVGSFAEKFHYFSLYASLFAEAYQLCGAAFLPSVQWHISSGDSSSLEWVKSIMQFPYLVFQSFPSLQSWVPDIIGLRCSSQSYLWMASASAVLGFSVAAPVLLVCTAIVVGIVVFWLRVIPRCCCECLSQMFTGESDDDDATCAPVVSLCPKECRGCAGDVDLSDSYQVELPAFCGEFGILFGPAYGIVSIGLGPLALTVMSSVFSSFSCTYQYQPPLVSRSINTTFPGHASGVECWSDLHYFFVVIAAISFIPVYMGMLYFSIIKKCKIGPSLVSTVLHSENTPLVFNITVDSVDHVNQLVPGTTVSNSYQNGKIEKYAGNGDYKVKFGKKNDLETVRANSLKILDTRFEHYHAVQENNLKKLGKPNDPKSISECPGLVLRSLLESKLDSVSPELKAKIEAQGGVYINELPNSPNYQRVRYNPRNALVTLQVKVVVAALAAFFGKSADWKGNLLLAGLFVANVVLLVSSCRNPATTNLKLNFFQLTCLCCSLVSTVVGMFASVGGSAALVSWLLGVTICGAGGLLIIIFGREKLMQKCQGFSWVSRFLAKNKQEKRVRADI